MLFFQTTIRLIRVKACKGLARHHRGRSPIRVIHTLQNPSILPSTLLSKPSETLKTLPLTNPLTNETIAHIPLTPPSTLPTLLPTPVQITQWRETPFKQRISHLTTLHKLITHNAEDLATIIHHEVGTPLPEAQAEVEYALDLLSWSLQPALQILPTTHSTISPHHQAFSTISPIGPVLAVSPFNLPLALAIRKLAPALAAGCTVIAKPSEKAVLPVLALSQLLRQAGLPDGVFVPVLGVDVVAPLLEGGHVKMLSFTGSTRVGRLLQRLADGKRCLLELGGNAPFIVFDDCDLDKAVEAVLKNGLRNAGQTCISANRIFVQGHLYDAFVEGVVNGIRDREIGPVIDEMAKEMVLGRIKEAVLKGGKIEFGGFANGNLVNPTVLSDVVEGMSVVDEETFGPVFSVMRFESEEEVVERANRKGGLAGYVFTKDIDRGFRMLQSLNVGMVGLNSIKLSAGATEFGGVGDAGLGREGGLAAIEGYCERKYCVVEN